MTAKQYADLLEYIFKNNGWNVETFYENSAERHRRCFKYVDTTFDSRDGRIFKITFRNGTTEGKTFRLETEADVSKVYKWLNKEIRSDTEWQR